MLRKLTDDRTTILAAGPDMSLPRGVFVLIFVTSMVMAIGNTGLISVMPAIGRAVGIPDHMVAAIFSLSALLWAISAPHWARVSDFSGRKPMMMLGLGGFVFSMLGCALVVWAGLQALLKPMIVFTSFLFIRGIFGILGSATASSSQAYVADRTSAKDRTSALSALAGALGMGTIIGPALSPLLVFGFLGLAGPMTIFALGAAGVLLLVALIIPRDIPPAKLYPEKFANVHTAAARKERGLGIWLDREIGPWLIYGFLSCCVQAINVYTLGFVVMDVVALPGTGAQGYIGMAMAAGACAGLLGQWVLIPWLKMSPRKLLWTGGILALAGNLLSVFAHDIWLLTLGYVILTLGFSFCRPGFTAGASLAARPEQQGVVAGMVSGLSGASIVLTPIIGVLLYEQSTAAPFALNFVIMGGLIIYSLKNRSLRHGGMSSDNSVIVS